MKKAKLLGFGLCLVMFTASLVSCANGADSSSSGDSSTPAAAPASGTPAGGTGGTGGGGSGGGNGGSGGGSTGANQTRINNAAEGDSITLSGTDTQLSITRGITINGNGLSGATITVSPSVARNVTLRNFTNSNIRVANVSSGGNSSVNTVNNGVFSSVRSVFGGIFRADNGSTGGATTTGSTDEKFKKVGDNALPLYLDNCTIGNIEAEGKVALYLEKGANKKSEINEIKLKSGAEDFSFIEFDDNGKEIQDKTETQLTDKSKVGNLIIDDNGVKKVNLIGGTFDNVSFGTGADNPTDLKLKYDAEFDNQLNFSGKNDFLNSTKLASKEDVAIAKHAANSGVYKFTMTRQEFETYNGNITIVFMTDTQKETVSEKQGHFTYWTNGDGSTLATVATYANPVYAAIPAGHFKVNDLTTTGYKTVQGAEFAYGDYAHATANGHPNWLEKEDIVVLSHYRNYNKEAFVINLGTDYVHIYVNTAAIKKNDLVVCIGSAGQSQAKAEYGSKASEMDLSNYTPYLAINRNYEGYTGGIGDNDVVTLNSQQAVIGTAWDLPYAQVLKMSNNEVRYALFTMTTATYPTEAAGLTYPNIEVPAGKHHPFESYLNDPDPGRL